MIDYLNLLIEQNKKILTTAQDILLKSESYKIYKKIEDYTDLENLIVDEKLDIYLSFYSDVIVLFIPNNKEDLSFHWDKESLIANEVFDNKNFKHARISKINNLNTTLVEFYNDRVEINMKKENPKKKYDSEIYKIVFNNNGTIDGHNITSVSNSENFSFFRTLKDITLTNKEVEDIKAYLLLNKDCSEYLFQKIKDYAELINDNQAHIPEEVRLDITDYKIEKILKKPFNKF